MGAALALVRRQANRFNVENRAHKVISKPKPTRAPLHPYAKEELEKVIKEHPEVIEGQRKKDLELENRLKQVFVTSQDPDVDPQFFKKRKDDDLNLPQNRQSTDDPEFGFHEPRTIPDGRVTLRQALKFITDHQADPKTWSVESVASKYKLSQTMSENILQYFKLFEVHIPEGREKKSLIDSVKSRIQIESGKST